MKIFLNVPEANELKYRKKWLRDKETMAYNKGLDLDIPGYDKETGTITMTDEELSIWYDKWIGHEPDRYYAYIYVFGVKDPVGEIYYYPENNTHMVGMLISNEYRGNKYADKALKELLKIAFEKNNIKELSDMIPENREGSIKVFKSVGFIITDNEYHEKLFDKEISVRQLLITKEMYDKIKKTTLHEDTLKVEENDDKQQEEYLSFE